MKNNIVKTCLLSAFVFCLSFSGIAGALTPKEDFTLYQMSRGSAEEFRAAARGIIAGHVKNTTVLDALAETTLQSYTKEGEWGDAVAWATRALGESRNARYLGTLEEIKSSKASRKIKKYAKKAAKQLGSASGTEQYKSGSVNLASVKSNADKAYARLIKSLQAPAGKETIAIASVGMSQSELMARAGPPTSTTAYITGKSFIPFNFRGKDSVRSMLLYKNQGYVVVSNSSAYTSNANVIEVVIDTSEAGYR